ncbi:MAG: hypothetical protein HRU38_20970 [Saccharospirillaceae bacterium]|nr:hypothetical protein [Pseudomonadales bacterium]NRB81104.1 hypothetical protein [Saccharospirillaceae bacterium]
MSEIEIKNEKFTKNYHNDLLPPIFIDQGCVAEDNIDFPIFIATVEQQKLKQLIDNARLTLLIAVDQLTNQNIIKALQVSADNNVRIYLYLGNEHKNKDAISALSSRCLIRTGEPQHGALLISDHNTFTSEGYVLNSSTLFTDNSDNDGNFLTTLTANQIQDTYRSFCHLFWNRSEKQIIKQGEVSSKAVSNPNGDIVVNYEYNLPKKLVDNFTSQHDTRVSQLNHHDLESSLSDKLFRATDNILDLTKANLAKSLVDENKNVALTDLNIPNIVATKNGCWLIPDEVDNQHVNWCIRFNKQQSNELINSLNDVFKAAQWQLNKSCTIDQLNADFMFVDETNIIYQCEEYLDVKLKPVYTDNINSFLDDSIEDLTKSKTHFTRGNLAKTIHYSVQRHPPYCPKNAKKAKIYNDWESANSNWVASLSGLEDKLNKLTEKRSSVSQSILSFFNRFSLGQQHKHKKLKTNIQTLHECNMITATPAERSEQQNKYIDFSNQLSQDDDATDKAINKAELENKWNDNKEKITKIIKDKNEICLQEKNSVDSLKINEANAYTQASDDFNKSREEALILLDNKYIEENKKLTAMDITQAAKWLKHNNKNTDLSKVLNKYKERLEEISQSKKGKETSDEGKNVTQEEYQQQILDNEKSFFTNWKAQCEECLKKQQQVIIQIRSMDSNELEQWLKSNTNKLLKQAGDTHTQRNNKIIREIGSAQKKLDNALNDKNIAQEALEKHGNTFSYLNTENNNTDELGTILGNIKNYKQPTTINWPDEALPISDELTLFEDNNKRFLTFISLDIFDQAQQEAKRLNAKLCVPLLLSEDA